jgi:hypothetical protein
VTGRARRAVGAWGLLLAAFSAVGLPSSAFAGASRTGKIAIDATLDRDRIAPGEVAILTLTIRSAGLGLPTVSLPRLEGVAVERAGESQNLSVMNGRPERSSTTMYRLIPTREGTLRIPPLRIAAGGEFASTEPITITVTRSAASSVSPSRPPRARSGRAPQEGTAELFVRATVDRPRIYWNQQTVLRLRLYSQADLIGDPDWKPPTTSGFWSEGLGPPRKSRATVNGVAYDVIEIPTALFPTRTGTLQIGAGQVRCRVARVMQPPDPWSMLAVPEVVSQDVVLATAPITITVDPLPGGAPAGFEGAVGDFQLQLRVEPPATRAGEPVLARATIRGTGNISTVRDPEIQARGSARQYVAGSATRIDRGGDRLVGERQIEVAFVGDQPGPFEILPVRLAWFDPEAKRYRVQTSEKVAVKVLPGGTAGHAPGQVRGSGPAIAAPRATSGPSGSLSLDPPVDAGAVLGLSALAFGAAIATGRVRRKALRDPRLKRMRSLEELLNQDLARAEALASRKDPGNAAALAEQALLKGVGLRFDADLAGVAREERAQILTSRGAAEKEIRDLDERLDSLDALAYAPPETRSQDAQQTIREARRILERYRDELGRAL